MRFLPGNFGPENVDFTFLKDNIAQEANETFAITFETGHTFDPGANIRDRLEGVIIDSDGRLLFLS